jgi:glycosyltransferase involved in cell wall biosynthesis
MHLCLVSLDVAPVRTSGLAVYAERVAAYLLDGGHDVTMIAARRPGTLPREERNGMHIVRVPVDASDWIGYSWRAARHVHALHRRAPFDVVHFLDVHFAWAYRGPYVASLHQSFRQRLTARGGQTYGSSWRNRLFRRTYYTAARWCCEVPALRRARALVAVSQATRAEFAQHYRVPQQEMTVIPEPVDTTVFAPRDTGDLRRELGLTERRVLVYIGFSTPRKGLEYLAATLADLPDDVRLIIIGQWEAGYRERVRAAAGAAWAKVIETGVLPDEAVPAYLALADLLVLPSLLEGFGIPALEALACGTPVVATTAGALPEVVGPCGILVPPGDASALRAAIVRLLHDEPLRQHLGACGRQRATTDFSIERAYQDMLHVYENLQESV